MRHLIVFFISALITLGVCEASIITDPQPYFVAKAKPNPDANTSVVAVDTGVDKVLIEGDTLMKYQLRHRYTVKCPDGFNYAAVLYTRNLRGVEVTLLSRQQILVQSDCAAYLSEPYKEKYIQL